MLENTQRAQDSLNTLSARQIQTYEHEVKALLSIQEELEDQNASLKADQDELFTKNTYIAMVKGVKDQAISKGLITKERWEKGIEDLSKSAEKNGVFYYTFFKAIALK